MTPPHILRAQASHGAGALFDRLLPMHLIVGTDRRIRHAGPTLRKMLDHADVEGLAMDRVLDVRRPVRMDRFADLLALEGQRLTIVLAAAPDVPLRGVLAALPGGDGALIDISLGLSFDRAVTRFGLTASDFSPSDQTVELLYLKEANAAIARLSQQLTDRLTAARAVAEQQALTDPLTGLANRRAMDAALVRLLRDTEARFSVLHLDLDFFKEVNDSHGHAAGDHVLSRVGEILRGEIRRMDLAARVGGDEFLVLLRDAVSGEGLAATADRLIRSIEKPIPFEGIVCRVSASIGIVATPSYAERPTLDMLMADADAALYTAKRAGRATFAIHGDPAGARVRGRRSAG